jgi:hypothetical protein
MTEWYFVSKDLARAAYIRSGVNLNAARQAPPGIDLIDLGDVVVAARLRRRALQMQKADRSFCLRFRNDGLVGAGGNLNPHP